MSISANVALVESSNVDVCTVLLVTALLENIVYNCIIHITQLKVTLSVCSPLFGEPDADEDIDVSPDTEDPDTSGSSVEPHQPIKCVSTREWVSSCNNHPEKLFQKVHNLLI